MQRSNQAKDLILFPNPKILNNRSLSLSVEESMDQKILRTWDQVVGISVINVGNLLFKAIDFTA